MFRKYRIVVAAALAASLSGATVCNAQAGTASGTLGISATVVNSCSVANTTLAFGTVSPSLGSVVPITSMMNVTCTLGTVFSVGLGDGSWPLAANGQRRLKGTTTGTYLNYNLTQDLLGTLRFGLTIPAQLVTNQLGLGVLPTSVAVYGAIPSGQSAAADTYTDTIPITVSY